MSDKPDPAILLRQTYAQYQQLQGQIAQLQVRLLTIVEVAGMETTEANEVLGVEFFAQGEHEDQ